MIIDTFTGVSSIGNENSNNLGRLEKMFRLIRFMQKRKALFEWHWWLRQRRIKGINQ